MKIQETSNSGNDLSYEVSVTMTNTGERIGSEVVMLFVSLPDNGTTTPDLQLRAFVKANDVPPRKRRTVTMKLDNRSSIDDARGTRDFEWDYQSRKRESAVGLRPKIIRNVNERLHVRFWSWPVSR